jgi:ATPases with chaperone activity, ATP-binding subunit
MLTKFSEKAQKVIVIAESVAFDLGHSNVGSEHLLISLLKIKESKMHKLLKEQGLTDILLKEDLIKLFGQNDIKPFYMEYSNVFNLVLESAVNESKERRESKVSLEALSYALILQKDCVSSELLKKYMIDMDQLEQNLRKDLINFSELDSLKDLTNLNKLVLERKTLVIGRDTEVLELIEVLCRKEKNNAIIVGETGVGKTALVEKLAVLMNNKQVPKNLLDKTIYELDLTSVVAGTKYRGEFEDKLKKIIQKVREDKKAILFIDEIHNIVGAGGAEGAIDASNILKPYLARKEITCIGATTYEEYYLHFEKEKALNRRFQKIVLEENNLESTYTILLGLKAGFEEFHQIKIKSELLKKIIYLADVYIKERYFPDKAIDVLDLACVRSKVKNQNELSEWSINEIVEKISGVSLQNKNKIEFLKTKLLEKIRGQNHAVEHIIKHLSFIEQGLVDKNQPQSVLLFNGPTGVGKSEIAKMIAKYYYGDEKHLIKLDMSEYKEASSVAKLIGAPAGYVGHEKQAKLVESVLQQPHSVVLLDEIEKAHKDVLNLFLQVFDEGYLEDSHKRKVYFRNALIIMTSNIGYGLDSLSHTIGFNLQTKHYKVDKELEKVFSFEFINRIDDIIHFNYLNKEVCEDIIHYYINEFYKDKIHINQEFINEVIEQSQVEKYGARSLLRALKQAVYHQIINQNQLDILQNN